MFKRTAIILSIIFIVQFVISCTCDCQVRPPYEIVFNTVSIGAFQEDDNKLQKIEDSVRKEKFRVIISIDGEEQLLSKNNFTAWGFSSAMACDCDRTPPTYNDKPIDVKLFMIDDSEQQPKKIANNFFRSVYTNFLGGEDTIEELLLNQTDENPYTYINLYCSEPDSLYEQASFHVQVKMQSGKEFEDETKEVFFK